ncbi:MAG: hypothetical protein ACPHL6_10545 [Rubripirellula sp.]
MQKTENLHEIDLRHNVTVEYGRRETLDANGEYPAVTLAKT